MIVCLRLRLADVYSFLLFRERQISAIIDNACGRFQVSLESVNLIEGNCNSQRDKCAHVAMSRKGAVATDHLLLSTICSCVAIMTGHSNASLGLHESLR